MPFIVKFEIVKNKHTHFMTFTLDCDWIFFSTILNYLINYTSFKLHPSSKILSEFILKL